MTGLFSFVVFACTFLKRETHHPLVLRSTHRGGHHLRQPTENSLGRFFVSMLDVLKMCNLKE